MARFVAALLALVVAVSAQDASYQQGLSLHNQQIQEHLRKEAEQQRQTNQFGGSFPQQQAYQPRQNNYEDDGQYRPELYSNSINNNNNNYNTYRPNPEQDYQAGLKAHQEAIQAHLRKEAQYQPQTLHGGDPAYQQGLQVHQRQLQDHLAKEQAHGGPAYSAPQQTYQPAYQQPQAHQAGSLTYHNPSPNTNSDYEYGIQLHNQQLAQHKRNEQEQQSQVSQASQFHASHPQQRAYYQPQANSYQAQQTNSYPLNRPSSGKVSLANLGF